MNYRSGVISLRILLSRSIQTGLVATRSRICGDRCRISRCRIFCQHNLSRRSHPITACGGGRCRGNCPTRLGCSGAKCRLGCLESMAAIPCGCWRCYAMQQRLFKDKVKRLYFLQGNVFELVALQLAQFVSIATGEHIHPIE